MADRKPLEARKYDLVIFGTTGFTGNLIVKHLIKTPLPPSFRWAITGRSSKKLENVYSELEKLASTGQGHKENLPTILDFATYSPESIIADARVVLSVIGPSTLHAEQFLKLAVEHGTSWVDLSGEPQFHRDMIGKYGRKAKETGAVVIPSCGMDCVPSDLGALLLAAQVGGQLGKVDAVYETVIFSPSTGTLQSIVAPFAKYSYEADVAGPTGLMKDPYYLCPDIETSALPKQTSGHEIHSIPANVYTTGCSRDGTVKPVKSGLIVSSGFIEHVNRSVQMRTVALQSQHPAKSSKASFSPSFYYREFLLWPTIISKFVTRLLALTTVYQTLYIFPYLLQFAFFQKFIMAIVKARGENTGLSKKSQDEDYLRLRMVGSSTTSGRKGFMLLETFKDPGYSWTAETIGEIAVYLALKVRDEKPEIGEKGRALLSDLKDEEADLIFEGEERKGGFWTPASLGVGLARWLNDRTSAKWETGWMSE